MQTGNIVEYIDRQKILCAVVLDIKSQRLRLLSENAREVTLSPQRLSHASGMPLNLAMGREALIQILKETALRRNTLMDQVDIPSLWEVLNTEQQWIDLATMTAFVFPEFQDADHESAVVRAFFKNRFYFKFSTEAFFPYTEEQTHQAIARAEKEEKKKRLISTGAAWLKTVLSSPEAPISPPLPDDHTEVVDILKSYYLFGKDSESHTVAKSVLSDAGIRDPEVIFQILVKAGVWNIHENLDLLFHSVPVDFPEEVLLYAARLSQETPLEDTSHGRKDLSNLHLLTIDGSSTLDFDDALNIEDKGDHYLLGIHISDVAEHIRKGDVLDREALSRASSIYMPDKRIPMIPPALSEDACSLIAERKRAAISVMIKITPAGKVIDSDIFPSLIAVDRQLSYPEADLLVDSDPEISLLHAVARLLRRRRLDEGAIHISLPEVIVQIEENGTPNVFRTDRESPARLLISEIMILANSVMAEFLNTHGMPAVFRSQPGPKQRLYQGESDSLFQNWMQRKLLSRFVLGTKGQRHDGLGLSAYVTATSPIRKYYDLITQRQIRAVLGLESPYSEEEISTLLLKLEHPMKYVPKLQYSRNRFWLLKYLESLIGQKEEAVVLSKRKDGYQILLPAYMIECLMPLPGGVKLKPEDCIRVIFQHVNARKDNLVVFMG